METSLAVIQLVKKSYHAFIELLQSLREVKREEQELVAGALKEAEIKKITILKSRIAKL